MIFASFGNVPKDFIRLAKAIDTYAINYNEEIIVQYGHTNYEFENVTAHKFIDNQTLKNYLKQSSVVILQGGWGTLSEAIELGCKIVAVPRIEGIEHNHDQIQLVKQLEELGTLIGVYDINDLSKAIAKSKSISFKPLQKGKASDIINKEIEDWFSNAK